MKNTTIAVLIGTFVITTAQMFGQDAAPATPAAPAPRTIGPRTRILPRPPAKPEPETTFETRKLATADISKIRLLVLNGSLQFTAGGVEYEYDPLSGSGEAFSQASKATACLALLAELRKAETIFVSFSVQLPAWPSDRKNIRLTELVIALETLK